MTAQNLRDMNLPEERVRSIIQFLDAYANTTLAELDELLGRDKEGEVPARNPSITDDQAFGLVADAATTLRELGQWLLYLDVEDARDALRRSGQLFYGLGQGFGLYLMVVAAQTKDEVQHGLFRAPLTTLVEGPTDEQARWSALRHPQQQAYLVLAATGHPVHTSALAKSLGTVLETSMHREGVVPVGALGTPIRRLWAVARHLYNPTPEALQVIAAHLSVMCRNYAETMALAQVNTHLWSHGAAPVDVGDIDIAGIAALAARQYSGDALLGALADGGLLLGRDSIALAPVEAGIALAEPWRTESLRG